MPAEILSEAAERQHSILKDYKCVTSEVPSILCCAIASQKPSWLSLLFHLASFASSGLLSDNLSSCKLDGADHVKSRH